MAGAVFSQCSLKVLGDVEKAVVDLFCARAVVGTVDAVLGEVAENDDARHDVAKPIKMSQLEFEALVALIVTSAEP